MKKNDIEMQYTILTDERLAKYIKFQGFQKKGIGMYKKWISKLTLLNMKSGL